MVLSTLVSGRKISSMARESKLGLMVPATMVNISKAKSTDMENSRGPTTVLMKDNSLKTISKGRESINGLMEEFIKVLGETTKWKVQAHSNGLTNGNMKEST